LAVPFLAAFFQQGAGEAAGGNPLLAFLPFILIALIFYFLIMRPQSKRQKEHKQMVEALQKGDRVVTAGGFHGTIRGINDEKDVVVLEIANNVKAELSRGSISRVVKEG